MSDRHTILPEDRIRSGRRLAVDIEAPRDRTVCFTVSDPERDAIDALAVSLSRTRSAVLTWIVTAFVEDCAAGDDAARVMTLFRECRAAIAKSQIPPHRK